MAGYCLACRKVRPIDDKFCLDCGLALHKIDDAARKKLEYRFGPNYVFPKVSPPTEKRVPLGDLQREHSPNSLSFFDGVIIWIAFIALSLAAVYGLVKFVQWAWNN
jgi:hypothetical protein